MTEAGFAVFALVGFLLPVPILAWFDRPKRNRQTVRVYAGHFTAGAFGGVRKMTARFEVETYSGYRADERPLRFTHGSDVHEVAEVETHWYSPDAEYFRVRTQGGTRYLLRHDPRPDTWSLAAEAVKKSVAPR